MKRLVITATAALLVAAALPASADQGTIPDCANISEGTGTYHWNGQDSGELRFEIDLVGDPNVCLDPNNTSLTGVTYGLYVIKDATSGDTREVFDAESEKGADAELLTATRCGEGVVSGCYTIEQNQRLEADPNNPDESGLYQTWSLAYSLEVTDNDPTICIFSVASGYHVTEGAVTDANGNGIVDDMHKGNAGENNRDGTKFDPPAGRSYFEDRAPDDSSPFDDCLSLNMVVDLVEDPLGVVGAGSGSRGYN